MKSASLTSLAMVFAAAVFAIPRLSGWQETTTADVELTVTVTDGSRYLTGLRSRDFRVLEDGVEQSVSSVTRAADLPLRLSVLVDASNSMEANFAPAGLVAVECTKRLRPGDVAEVLSVNRNVARVQEFTSDAALVEQAVARIRMQGSTALHNALAVALHDVQKSGGRTPRSPRSALLVLSDGIDTSSVVEFDRVLELARETDAVIYGAGPNGNSLRPGQSILPRLAAETGGAYIAPDASTGPAQICDRVLADLSSQYTVRYVSTRPRRDAQWHSVEVRVGVPQATVRTRFGYLTRRVKTEQ